MGGKPVDFFPRGKNSKTPEETTFELGDNADGRPTVGCGMGDKFRDALLDRLRKVHGEPRYDLAPDAGLEKR